MKVLVSGLAVFIDIVFSLYLKSQGDSIIGVDIDNDCYDLDHR
jgi:hypothetical protein